MWQLTFGFMFLGWVVQSVTSEQICKITFEKSKNDARDTTNFIAMHLASCFLVVVQTVMGKVHQEE